MMNYLQNKKTLEQSIKLSTLGRVECDRFEPRSLLDTNCQYCLSFLILYLTALLRSLNRLLAHQDRLNKEKEQGPTTFK